MTRLLEASALTASYGQGEILHGLDFVVDEGEVTALLGANGAGKTTTLRAVSGMLHTGGKILFQGRRIDGLATDAIARLGIAHVPDGRGTFMELSVEENLRLGAYTRRDRDLPADRERVLGYFPKLRQRLTQQAGTLSGGEQQMLALARALLLRPKLLLLDEPSVGLAPLIVQEIFAILHRIQRSETVSILIVEQNATLALAIASRAYLLETGRIVFAGSAATVARDPAMRRAYLGY